MHGVVCVEEIDGEEGETPRREPGRITGEGDSESGAQGGIEPAPANVSEVDTRFIEGVVKLPESLLIVLRFQEVLGG